MLSEIKRIVKPYLATAHKVDKTTIHVTLHRPCDVHNVRAALEAWGYSTLWYNDTPPQLGVFPSQGDRDATLEKIKQHARTMRDALEALDAEFLM